MRIQVVKNTEDALGGIESLVIENDKVPKLSAVVSNSCTVVILDKSLDLLSYESAVQCISESLTKVRLGGEIIINGLCLDSLCNLYKSDQLDIHEINKVLFELKSIQNYNNMLYTLEQSGFNVEVFSKNGIYYEIKAKRVS